MQDDNGKAPMQPQQGDAGNESDDPLRWCPYNYLSNSLADTRREGNQHPWQVAP